MINKESSNYIKPDGCRRYSSRPVGDGLLDVPNVNGAAQIVIAIC